MNVLPLSSRQTMMMMPRLFFSFRSTILGFAWHLSYYASGRPDGDVLGRRLRVSSDLGFILEWCLSSRL